MLTFCCSQMFDSSKDYFLIENCKIFLSIIVNYHFCHTRFALIGGHVGHVGYNCHVVFFKMDLGYSIWCIVSFIDQFNSFCSSLTSKWLQENPVLHIFNNCVAAILKFKMADIVQKVGCCQFWKISIDFLLHHANIDTYIEKCIMLQWYINIIFLYWPLTFYCVFLPLLNIGESCRNALRLFYWFHNKKRSKRPSNWTFFLKFVLEAVSPWAFCPLSGNSYTCEFSRWDIWIHR